MKVQTKKPVDYLFALIRWRKTLIRNFIIVCMVTAFITLLLPLTFTSSTVILPPVEDQSPLGLSSLLENVPIGGLSGITGMGSEESNLFLAIVNSRTVIKAAIDRFDLMQRFDVEDIEEAIKILRNRVTFKINEEGTLTLTAKASTPFIPDDENVQNTKLLARDLSSFFISALDSVNKRIKMEKARNTRKFIEKRYEQNLRDLKAAEEAMKKFGEKYGLIALPEQTEAMIDVMADIKSRVIQKDVEVDLLRRYIDADHPQLERAKNELYNLQQKYNELLKGSSISLSTIDSTATDADIIAPFYQMPELGLQYTRLLREVKLQNKLLTFLLPEYEQAKIQEARDTPTVQVLDPANIPTKKSAPKRSLIVLLAGFSILLLSIAYIWTLEYLQVYQQKDPEGASKLLEIKNVLLDDWNQFLRKVRLKKRTHS